MSEAGLFPYPITDYIPKAYSNTTFRAAFEEFIDRNILDIYNSQVAVRCALCPEKCPDEFLFLLANMLAVPLSGNDREDRLAIQNAASQYKNKGIYDRGIKQIIDGLTGSSSSLFSNSGDDQSYAIFPGGYRDEYATDNWNLFGGGDDATLEATTDFVFDDGTHTEQRHIIKIDLGSSTLTQTVVDSVHDAFVLQFGTPAYTRVWFGYLSSGMFVRYSYTKAVI